VIALKRTAQRLFPKLYVALYRARRDRQQAAALMAQARQLQRIARTAPLEAWIQAVLDAPAFCASQQADEIRRLLARLIALQPRYVCEIGCYRGGTLFLFCQAAAPDAHLISLDLAHAPERLRAYQHFRRHGQRLSFVSGDSHAPQTSERVRRLLRGAQLDFLFIDGDHSYAGVRADFETYAPLVRSGGLIALHDILPDRSPSYGERTVVYSGEVYRFWQEVKTSYAHEEYIQAPDQDGYGIGVLIKP
jgi:cephalosporin hydroxylase